MSSKINRREFVLAGAAAAGLAGTREAFGEAPAVLRQSVAPVVISDRSGFTFRNGGTQSCIERAFDGITRGEDVLDAIFAGVNIVENDPEESGVGFGGTPNADGVVQLDSCCMHGPRKQAGGVAAIEGVRTPSIAATPPACLRGPCMQQESSCTMPSAFGVPP